MPFDVEVFANSMKLRRVRGKNCRGPDSPLYTVLYPVICIIKLFGLAPYKFSGNQVVPSDTLLVFSVLFSAIYMYQMFVLSVAVQSANTDHVSSWTWAVMVVFNFGVAMYEILVAVFTRKPFVRVWNAIQDYDEAVRQLGYPRKEIRTAVVAWSLLIVQGSAWTVVSLTSKYIFNEKWLYNLGYISIYLGTSLSLYKFVGTACLLAQRFSHLAELAATNLPQQSGFMNPGKVTRKTVQVLLNDLMLAGECLNSMYSWSLFFWLANICMHILNNTYLIITWFVKPTFSESHKPLIGCYVSWMFAFALEFLLFHAVCDYASNKVNDIHVILVDWNVRLARRFPKTEVIEPSFHLLSRKLQFSAAGCFYVNLPLLRSIVAVLSTYLVILLQLPN